MGRQSKSSRRARKFLVRASVVLLLVVLIAGFRLVEEIGPEKKPGDRYIVARIIDGDTMELMGGDRVRLLGIDTPEEGEPYYDVAKHFLDSLTLGKPLRIEFAGRRRDRYGRLLGYAYVDSIFVNKAILDNGLGYLYLFKDNDLAAPEIRGLMAAQTSAINGNRGIWSIAHDPEDRYLAVPGSFRFHRPGCRSIQDPNDDRYIVFRTREEALLKGLSPCRNCKP